MRRYIMAAVVALVILLGSSLPAAAWTSTGGYFGSKAFTPNWAAMWGNFSRSGSRYLQAESSDAYWDAGRVDYTIRTWLDAEVVFHIFRKNSNCARAFAFTGYWWTNAPGPYANSKFAGCSGQSTGGHNELRAYANFELVVPNQRYYFGGEFVDQGGGSLDGEVTYDTYLGNKADWEYHNKWCFNGNDSIYGQTNGSC